MVEADRIGFAVEICDDEVWQQVVVEVCDGDAHAALALSGGISSGSAEHGFFGEGAILLIDPEEVWVSVVGDENVCPAITVPVARGDSQSGTAVAGDSGDGGRIGEQWRWSFVVGGVGGCWSAGIVEESIGGAGEDGGAAEIGASGRIATFVCRVVVNVVCDEQVQPAIAIVVEEGR